VPAAAVSSRRKVPAAVQPSAPSRFPRVLAALAGVAALAVLVVAIYQFGDTPAVTGAQSTPAPSAGLDQEKVAALMARVQADPNDTAALLELGDAFFQVQDFTTAATWLDKLVILEPNNVRGRLALGAAYFNLGKNVEAEAQWLAVLEVDKDNVEAHYDLGFLYLNEVPPDYEGVESHWGEVVRLAPGTEIATVVQQHLDALAAESAAPSAGASAGASPAPTSGASPAPAGSPSASVVP
jgi:cytochrome c-type biogenesis protein CcmH/NrfG